MTVTPVTELFIAGTWVNISADVYDRDPVTITRGRADESASVNPSTCTLTLNNRDGKYSPRNPLSPYYGSIGRNTPIRVSFVHNAVTYRRFTGEVSAWPPKWVLGGADVWVPIEAAGIIRRLGQGRAPVQSALYRRTATLAGLARHWPLEDSRLREGVPDGAMTIIADGTVPEFGRRPEFGVDAGPAGAAKSLRMRPTHSMQFGTRQILGGWSAQVWVTPGEDALAGPGSEWFMAAYVAAGGFGFVWDLPSGAMLMQTLDDDASQTGSDTATLEPDDGPALVTMWCSPDGSEAKVCVDLLSGSTALLSSTTGPQTYLASMWGLQITNNATFGAEVSGTDTYLSHLAIGEAVDWTGVEQRLKTLDAGAGHAGETAGARIERLCLENGIVLQPKGNLAATERMGPQPAATLLELMSEAATVDMGILHEPRDVIGLAYRTRESMHDQVV